MTLIGQFLNAVKYFLSFGTFNAKIASESIPSRQEYSPVNVSLPSGLYQQLQTFISKMKLSNENSADSKLATVHEEEHVRHFSSGEHL